MDPVCHTLVGASLGATGLERRTRFGRSTLLIAANLPDADFVFYFVDNASAYAFRRGITHGLPAILVLPLLLALVMAAVDRLVSKRDEGPDVSLRWLVILSLIGVASHPALDWLNNYGMRWFMPFSERWFYGDTLFIIDPVVWLTLIVGVWLTYRSSSEALPYYRRPASIALAVFVGYVLVSLSMTRVAEDVALAQVSADPPNRVMASPVPANPLRRNIIFDYGAEYRFATVVFTPGPGFSWEEDVIETGDPELLQRARETRDGGWFLRWSRFPYVVSSLSEGREYATVADARYVRDLAEERLREFGAVVVEIEN
jgi:inner membrane protein